nr:filamentous haemagglutinin family protein [Alcaligenes faecalis]
MLPTRLTPVAAAIATLLIAGGIGVADVAQAQPRAFSGAWFAAKGAVQRNVQNQSGPAAGANQGLLNGAARQHAESRQQLARSVQNLGRTASAIAAQQAAQKAAREAAAKEAGVPDGHVQGGLWDRDAAGNLHVWTGAERPVHTQSDGKHNVAIKQTDSKAILNWETFNVGRNTTVQFQQKSTDAVLNRVMGADTAPSQIQGAIKGDGTVMVVNQNGVVFSGSSQVNVRNLVTAAAKITDEQFNKGLYVDANGTQASFTDAAGKVLVERGAQITTHTPTSSTQDGGYVLLLGSEVDNAGHITTPKGQTVLAAGDSFYIRKGVGTDGNVNSTTAGNEVSTSRKAGSTSGKVTNTGLIAAANGDITLTGHDVTQAGVAVATTSQVKRGTIHLSTRASDTEGKVTLGKDSVTAILLDETDTTALDNQRDAALKKLGIDPTNNPSGVYDNLSTVTDRRELSRVEIVSGNTVEFQGDSMTLATGGEIVVSAKQRTLVDDAARLDVSGAMGVQVAMDTNNLAINIQGNEMRDAPVNRDSDPQNNRSKLSNLDIWVDRRNLIHVPAGTNGYEGDRWYTAGGLLEVSGWLATSGHSVGEWMAQGGTITVTGNDLVTRAGSQINLSGGTLDVQSGYLRQSWLRGADGRLYTVDKAPGDLLYDGIYKGYEQTSQRWGVTRTYYNHVLAPTRRYEEGYTVGRDAGKLVVATSNAVLEGDIVSDVYQGARQTQAAEAGLDGYYQSQRAVARRGQLIVGQYTPIFDADEGLLRYKLSPLIDRVALADVNERIADALQLNDPVTEDRQGALVLDTGLLNESGLGAVRIAANERIAVEDALTVASGGEIVLYAPGVDVGAALTTRSGAIRLGNVSAQPYGEASAGGITYRLRDEIVPVPTGALGGVLVRESAVLNASGLMTDLRGGASSNGNLAHVDGGMVAIRSSEGAVLAAGSLIDVSSGVTLRADGSIAGGTGGDLMLAVETGSTAADARLQLEGALAGYGVVDAGTLTIQAPRVSIGAQSRDNALVLSEDFFEKGFANYRVIGEQGLAVAKGAEVKVQRPLYRFHEDVLRTASGIPRQLVLEPWLASLYEERPLSGELMKRPGASLFLQAGTRQTGAGQETSIVLDIGRGSLLEVDPGQRIELRSVGQLNVDGRLNAWGGSIELGSVVLPDPVRDQVESIGHQRAIRVGEQGVLDVAARAVTALDFRGRRYGLVADGGSIFIGGSVEHAIGKADAAELFVDLRPGSLLDASGAQAQLDLPGVGQTLVNSAGGSISLASANGLYLDGDLRAFAGGEGAAAGGLTVALTTPNYLANLATDQVLRPRELIVGQQREVVEGGQDSYVYGHGCLAASQVKGGGFGDLTLFSDGLLSFAGDLDLNLGQRLRLYSGALGLSEDAAGNSRIRLSAPSLLLAGAFPNDDITENNETRPLPTSLFQVSRQPSEAFFEASGQVLDIRDSLVFGSRGSFRDASGGTQAFDRRGFDRVELSSTGDMRLLAGNATPVERINTQVLSGGDLHIRAAQLYPGTGAGARILAGYGYQPDGAAAAFDPARSLLIERSDATTPEQPLAVFGRLSLGAARVIQGGVVRAPLGYLEIGQNADKVELLAGSLTSVSGAGLTLPYGGTVDGQVWRYAGKEIALTGVGGSFNDRGIMETGVDLGGRSVRVASGATLDLSGGGELLGAGFVSGRGGSTDARYNPLVRFDEDGRFDLPGLADNPIYAIVPGVQRIAPVAAEGGAVDPLFGQQISIGGGVPGLPAGTYTLLPSTYALLPGAYRVELNGQAGLGRAVPTQLMRSGSWSLAGQLSLAGTGVHDELFRQVLLTSADVLRRHSQYNETSYSDFAKADAARHGIPRPMLPVDARSLRLDLSAGGGADALVFDGNGLFQAASGGYGGSLVVLGNDQRIEIVGAGAQASEGFQGVTLRTEDLNAFGAARMVIGSTPAVLYGQGGNYVTFDITDSTQSIVLRNGAQLAAPEVFLLANRPGEAISLEQGAAIVTLGRGAAAYDARDGFLYAPGGRSMLALSNGMLNVLPPEAGTPDRGPGDILLGVPAADGVAGETRLYSEGSLVTATDKRFVLADSVRYGTRNLTLAAGGFNVGEQALLTELAERGVLPTGLALDQQVFDRLLQGDTSAGAPALETLVLNARDALNFYGDVSLDSYDPGTGRSRLSRLVLGTPAIYGYGDSNSVASIRTSNLIWNGAQTPAAGVIAGGAGSGQGTLDIRSERLEFGYGPFSQPGSIDSYQRLALGFATVNLAASERITANHKGSLAVYQSQGEYRAGSGYAYSGGDLNLITPLLTGEAGSRNSLLTGGALRVSAGGGGAASTPVELANGALGAELALEGASLLLDTRVGLASGKLSLAAQDDLELGADAQLDLAGRALRFDDVIRYSWGGEVNLLSRGGNIRQAAASRIDLSASNNHAGSLKAVALDSGAGVVDLQGRILAASSGEYDAGGTLVPYASGSVEIRAQGLGEDGTLDSRFAALNQRLNAGQVYGARSFQIKQGDLNIGSDVKASMIEVSLDGGHLSVNGVLDASGEQVGSIRLAAKQGLSIGSGALLDAHGRRLRVDSYGKIIDSPNRALIELQAGDGLLSLAAGARIDLRHGTEAASGSAYGQNDGIARGTLDLHAPRLGGATAGDIAIDASGPLHIIGARAVNVNAVQRYDDAPVAAQPAANGRPYQEITQAYLDGKHQQSELFMQAALANSALLDSKLAGLNNVAYAQAFHLRPGVEIVSATADGDLVLQGDLDLSGHRYASLNPHTAKTSVYGSGEAGSLAIRAGGDLNIYGSVTDGFAPPPETDDDQGWLLLAGQDRLGGDRVVPTAGVRLDDDSFFPAGRTLNFELPIKAMTLAAGTRLPVEAVLSQPLQLPAGTVLEGALLDAAGNLLRPAGSQLGEALDLPAGTRLGAGSRLPLATPVTGMTWPGGVPLPGRAMLANGEVDGVRLAGGLALRAGAFLPAGSDIRLPDGAASVDVRPAGAVSRNWAIAPMLAAGSQSWSLRLVAGADLQAADPRLTDPRSSGQMRLADTHYGMRRIPAAGGGLVWTQEGVDEWGDPSIKPGDPLDPEALGYPTICDDFPTWCAASSGGMVWTEEGVNEWGDPSIKPGDPLDPEALGYPTICDDFPTWCAASSDDYALEAEPYASRFSVLRTGTGDLDLFAAGNLRMDSPFGVYTAGTASIVDARYNLPRARDGGSVLRDPALGGYEQWVDGGEQSLYSAWYPTQGGNLTLAVGGDLSGDILGRLSGAVPNTGYDSAAVGNWLWRQGSASTAGTADATAWWVNFGTYARRPGSEGAAAATQQVGFTGIGTLGGGDLSVKVAGDAGVIEARTSSVRSQGLVLAVGGSGRVGADGQLTLSGGGDMDVRIGGALNPLTPFDQNSSLYGAMVNLRGNAQVRATSLGGIDLIYGRLDALQVPGERRAYDPFVSSLGLANGGPTLVPGDATFSLNSLGDLVLQGMVDPGRTPLMNGTPYTSASGVEGYGVSGFSLWTDRTAIDLTSAGGNLTPVSLGRTEQMTDSALVYPAKLSAVALAGSLYYGNATRQSHTRSNMTALTLAPSSQGRLDLLAGDSIYAGGYSISRSGASAGSLATPLNPSYHGYTGITRQVDNLSSDGSRASPELFPLFAFGANSVSGEWAAGPEPSRFYALTGDLVGVDSGRLLHYTETSDMRFGQMRYEGYGAVRMIAGRDIVSSGTGLGVERAFTDNATESYASSGNLFVNISATDVSLVQAGRDILYGNFNVAGPGSLEISAGRNLLMDDEVAVTSLGAVAPGDARSGASLVLQAGANQADFSGFLQRYLDTDSLALAGTPLAEQPGKVVRTYESELVEWLAGRYGFSGDGRQAREFLAYLPPEQQRIFARGVYFAELKAGGREYNEVGGVRQGSYLRGRNAIAALFPEHDAAGNPIRYSGDIIMYGGAGVHTHFGGDIQLLTPGGQHVFGIEGKAPPSTAGVITRGQGNIQLYALGSILLGQSRIMTTFGGDILAWSATGDINAGRGSKTTLVYAPPRRVYDDFGNVEVTPDVPATGAGIATLNRGDVDLIAPLGTIDAGEAGIRVAGNVNVAALHVVNADNIQVQGDAKGVPVAAAVNTGALTSASAAASSAAAAAQDTVARSRAEARQNLPSIVTVQILGFGDEPISTSSASMTSAQSPRAGQRNVSYQPDSVVRVLGLGDNPSTAQQHLTPEERSRMSL